KRAPFREEHLRLANEARNNGTLIMGGALADPADGALLVFKADSPQVAEDFAKNDPYVKNGLITEWKVRPWTVVVGANS
ncbi:MAG TPA: YciI-like protein, partial [Cyclobacteriaceae bacterium]|nr:YciI-like protein [Cyclobacteriaceae bacterium]